ncbi:hypothetical protein [Methylobacterium organophilum]|uniref:Uncharacterized protein n=1 Tax=Methylobacterium organophilum TaxID=410 RepID=A0ABQ4TC92_METOR|nr:hypothetical protein [Methylobacterium organophilum]GJE27745.1 hypothetical protein LKMONMHP_2606 [Methylobacterium organophilum]
MKTGLKMLLLVAPVLVAGPALAQQTASVTMEGRCEKLVIGGQDITQNCKEKLVNTVSGTRTSFDFAAWDGQTLSFSGVGAQQERTEETDPLQPISLVIPGKKDANAIVRNPAPAVGSCTFSTPEPGKTMIACTANSAGKTYEGVFVTEAKASDAKKPEDAPKR